MEYLGQGWQYRVYDLGNGRVRKIEQNQLQRFFLILRNRKYNIVRSWRDLRGTNISSPIAINNIKSKLSQLDVSRFGNPTFREGINYDQDKVVPLGVYFEKSSLQESQEKIDQYIELLKYMWKYGFGDIVYNFSINNGVTSEGKLIMLDIGELCFDKDSIRDSIIEKIWQIKWSYRTLKNENIKEYYRNQMEKHITIEAFDKMWNTI
jgi:hypothetical protein